MNKRIGSLVTAVLIGFAPAAGLAQAVPQMRQGTPYAQARKNLLRAGWQAVHLSPKQRGHELFGIEKETVEDLGYSEMVACSGTGAGFCRFEFAAADGRRLAVVTTPSQQGPKLYRWWIEKRQ